MAEITMTVNQIKNLGLWDKVCEFKGWNPYILNEGRISYEDEVTFDDEFKIDSDDDESIIDKYAVHLEKGIYLLENRLLDKWNYLNNIELFIEDKIKLFTIKECLDKYFEKGLSK